MQYHWGEFFHRGRPGGEWPPYDFRDEDKPGRATAVFDSELLIELDPKADHRRAWEGFDMREWGNGRADLMDSLAEFFGLEAPEDGWPEPDAGDAR